MPANVLHAIENYMLISYGEPSSPPQRGEQLPDWACSLGACPAMCAARGCSYACIVCLMTLLAALGVGRAHHIHVYVICASLIQAVQSCHLPPSLNLGMSGKIVLIRLLPRKQLRFPTLEKSALRMKVQ